MSMKSDSSFGWVYFLGIIGASVYYVQQSTTLWMGVLGVGKGIVWPAMLVYYVFETLKM